MNIITSEAAAPYVELYELLPRYNPMKYFPMENRTDVITAPNQTYLHEIKTSGRYLNIIAKSNVIIMKEEIIFIASDAGSMLSK